MKSYLAPESVRRSIQLFHNYLGNNIATHGNRHAGFVLDIGASRSSGRMGIGATGLGLSLYGMIPQVDDRHISQMERYLLSKRQRNGTWTISALEPHDVTLIYTTCYVLQGLARSDQQRHARILQSGINWLLSMVNCDGAWGLAQLQPSHIHPTSEVLFLFSILNWSVNPEVILSARDWLLSQRANGGFWADDDDRPSAFLTALAYRSLTSSHDYKYELEDTRDWLLQQLTRLPCIEERKYYIPAGGSHIIESVSSFTRALAFEALAVNSVTDYEPLIEQEAKRLLKSQSALGYWKCDASSSQIPMFLNYHVCSGLVSYARYLDRRPKHPWLHDFQRQILRYPISGGSLLILAIIGAVRVIRNMTPIATWIGGQVQSINTRFEQLSGIANLLQITGLSTLGAIVFFHRLWKAKSS